MQAHDLAEVLLHVLGRVEFLTFAGRNEQVAVGREQDSVPVMTFAGNFWMLAPDNFEVVQCAATVFTQSEPGARDSSASCIVLTGFDVTYIDEIVRSVIRMQYNIAKSALTAVIDIGNAGVRGADLSPFCVTTINRPFFSVTSRRPSGRKLIAQGSSNEATGVATKSPRPSAFEYAQHATSIRPATTRLALRNRNILIIGLGKCTPFRLHSAIKRVCSQP